MSVRRLRVGGIDYDLSPQYLLSPQPTGSSVPLLLLRATYPGFRPVTQFSRSCPPATKPQDTSDCISVTFTIAPPSGVSNVESFENLRRLSAPAPLTPPPGYEVYQIGVVPDELEVFRKVENGRQYVLICNRFTKNTGVDAVCNDLFRASSGGLVEFLFRYSLLGKAPSIEDGLLDLVNSYTARKGGH